MGSKPAATKASKQQGRSAEKKGTPAKPPQWPLVRTVWAGFKKHVTSIMVLMAIVGTLASVVTAATALREPQYVVELAAEASDADVRFIGAWASRTPNATLAMEFLNKGDRETNIRVVTITYRLGAGEVHRTFAFNLQSPVEATAVARPGISTTLSVPLEEAFVLAEDFQGLRINADTGLGDDAEGGLNKSRVLRGLGVLPVD